ncbi:MAG: STAS domain-containing protein [Oscillospiraceae bacterium]|nr:STAS domain-containing protein [Oscillospiraceae bacterium]
MKLQYVIEDGTLVLMPEGEIDHHAAQSLLASMGALIDARRPMSVTLDFSGVSFMDSSGIAVILNCYRRVGEFGGVMRVVSVAGQARRVLNTAGVERLVNISYAE